MYRKLKLRGANSFNPITGEVRTVAWWDCETCDKWLLDCECPREPEESADA